MNNHTLIKITFYILALLLVSPSNLYSQEGEFDETSTYRVRNVHGWTVYIQKRLLREKRIAGARAYVIVTDQLSQLTRMIPAQQLKQLQQVAIWICDRSDGPIHYHPQREWLIKNGYNPAKAKAVDISQVNNIIRSENTQPSVMLHELAHAYHDQVLGFDNMRLPMKKNTLRNAPRRFLPQMTFTPSFGQNFNSATLKYIRR
jgi:hypothetical protein